MKVKLEVKKENTPLVGGVYSVTGAESFGKACADLWQKLEAREFERATSVGALMEKLGPNALELIDGAVIAVSKA